MLSLCPTVSNQDNLSVLYGEDLSKFVVYGDLNCPFCFALHERFSAWDLLTRIEWRLIVHAPELSEAVVGESLDDLYQRADKACYQAKNNGRNRVEVAG